MLLGARYYDASLGRFISRDPIRYRGRINLFAYAGNDPVNATDPSGLDREDRQFLGNYLDLFSTGGAIAAYAEAWVRDVEDYKKQWKNKWIEYTDCGKFCYFIIHNTYDKNYPRGWVPTQWGYVKHHPGLYETGKITDWTYIQPGDILFTDYKGNGTGNGHTGFYIGKDYMHKTISASVDDRPPEWRKYYKNYKFYTRPIGHSFFWRK